MSSPTYLLQTRSVIYHIIYPCVSLKSCQCQRTNPFLYIESFPCYWSHNLHSSTVLNTAKSNAPNAFPNSRVLLACYCATHKGPTGSHDTNALEHRQNPERAPASRGQCSPGTVCRGCCVHAGAFSQEEGLVTLRFSTQGVHLRKGLELSPLSLTSAYTSIFSREIDMESSPKHRPAQTKKNLEPPEQISTSAEPQVRLLIPSRPRSSR